MFSLGHGTLVLHHPAFHKLLALSRQAHGSKFVGRSVSLGCLFHSACLGLIRSYSKPVRSDLSELCALLSSVCSRFTPSIIALFVACPVLRA